MCSINKKKNYNPDIDPVKTYERKVKPDKEFYNKVINTKKNDIRTLVYEDTCEPHTGNAFFVKAGQIIRIEQRPSLHNGRTQIADILFVTPDLKQISDHLNTSAFEGLNPRLYSGIWSQSGVMEKLATVVADEFPYELLDHDKISHMFFAAHCCPEWIVMVHGKNANINSCHENFIHGFNRLPAVQAIKDKKERRKMVQLLADRNDINVFQPNFFTQDENGITRCQLLPCPAVPDGTGIEFYAEKDLYAVISNCPYGDQALPFPEAKPNPIYISVWDTKIAPKKDKLQSISGAEWEEIIYKKFIDGTKDISPK